MSYMNRIIRNLLLSALVLVAPVTFARAQQPSQAQVQAAMADPQLRARVLARIRESGMTPDQIRAQLKAMGYGDDVINQILGSGSATATPGMNDDVFAAVKSLGIIDSASLDSLRLPFDQRRTARDRADSLLLDTLAVALKNDSLRAAILNVLQSPTARRVAMDSGFALFGRDVFARTTNQFDPGVNGPLPPNYKIGYGDQFTLVFTGDFERTEPLTVTRDGWIVVKDAGQIQVANLTSEQLRVTLATRLGRVYSGIGRGTLRFSLLPTRVGTNQVFVHGDVAVPNAYQISRLGTVLTALYAAGGPTDRGDARSIEVRRDDQVIATVDLYDYLTNGSSAGDVLLENGDVIFVRPEGPRVRVAGAVVRPATYELKPGESLADAIRLAGGFRADADRRRVQIERIVPASLRGPAGSDKEVLDITSPALSTGYGPTTQKLETGDVIRVFSIAPGLSNKVDVLGNVFQPGRVAYTEGMRLSQAIERAGGLKPDTYLGGVLVSRLQKDSSRAMTRVALNPDGTPVTDMELSPNDVVRTFSITEFRTSRYITVGGAVKRPQQILYRDGMTMRDAIMLAGGLAEYALLTQAEIGRLPENRANGATATRILVPLDSTYLFERGPDGKYLGPPGIPAPSARAPEFLLEPYDAVSVLRQPEFEYIRTVSIAGSVKHAGSYTLLSKSERLSDLIQRAGGLASDADSAAIVFLRRHDSTGRIGVDLPKVLKNPRHADNLILVDRDSIFIPAYNAVVMVRGEVNAARGSPSPATAVAYVKGADIDYYIRSAGGGTTKADEGMAYVTQPSGKVETKHRTALFYTVVPKPQPGAIVQVPERDPARRRDWLTLAQSSLSLIASLITVAVLTKQL
jgi:protein involved in polysaccharide export with SLBB domain